MPELLHAADLLEDEGAAVTVIDVTSADRMFKEWHSATRRASAGAVLPAGSWHLASLLHEVERHSPILTVHDASPHALAWLGSVYGSPLTAIGVDEFGESGTIPELYDRFGLLPEQIANTGLMALHQYSTYHR